MNTDLQKLISIIKTGSPTDVKLAQKQIEKIWRDSCRYDNNTKEQIFYVFLEELKLFSQIKDIDHQAYFINTLKWPLYFIGKKYFPDWSNFILTHIQHPSGKIRQAIIKASDYLIIDLQLDFEYAAKTFRNKDLKIQDIKNIIANDKKKFGYFVIALNDLIRQYYEPIFKKYKYINSLPTGVYKSLQILLANIFRSEFYEKIYQDFLKELSFNESLKPNSDEILNKRQQISEQFEQIIQKTNSPLKFEDIKNIIYNESGRQDIQKIINNFQNINDFSELQQIVSLIMDAWNYWPHKNLGGLAPVEKN